MQVRIRQFTIMMIATLMLFSTTGLAIYHHICGCPVPMAHITKVSDPEHGCCSVPETPAEPVCCSDDNHEGCDSEYPDQCKNEVTYLKAPIISTMPVQELTVSEVSFGMPDARMPDTGLADESLSAEPLIPSYVLPPRAGGSLVILLHSIKIPFPEDHC